MPTFIPEVSPYKRRDGTYLVKIRITHNRKTLRKPSGIYATAEQLNKERTRVRDKTLLEAVNQACERLRLAAAKIEGEEFMDAATLWRAIQARLEAEKGFTLDFFAFADTIINRMEKGTAAGYKYALLAFSRYLGSDRCDVNEIDKAMVAGFRDWIERKNGKGCRASSAYLEKLRHIHNEARARYNDDDTGLVRIPRRPFVGMIPQQPRTQHRALTADELRRVLATSPTTSRGRMARDVFALSFSLMGINTADLYKLRKGDLLDGVLTYNRAKTDSKRGDKAEFRVRVEPEAEEIVKAYKGQKGLLSFADRYGNFADFNRNCNVGLKEVGRLAGVGRLTTGHARHTWATIARNDCGIPRDTVGECLNHAPRGRERVDDIYIARDWARLWDVNRRVLDFVISGKSRTFAP